VHGRIVRASFVFLRAIRDPHSRPLPLAAGEVWNGGTDSQPLPTWHAFCQVRGADITNKSLKTSDFSPVPL
jgi:hypothetical protein